MIVNALVLRKPVFMEDEGGYSLIRQFNTVEEANDWVEAQAEEFFRPHDYLVVEV